MCMCMCMCVCVCMYMVHVHVHVHVQYACACACMCMCLRVHRLLVLAVCSEDGGKTPCVFPGTEPRLGVLRLVSCEELVAAAANIELILREAIGKDARGAISE
jgi:hypothetical protein